MEWGGEGLGTGFSSSPEDDVWSCPAFIFVCFGCLAILCFFRIIREERFFWVEYVDFQSSLQLPTSSHLRERDKMLLRAILCGSVWNGFLLGKAKKENVPCRYCGKRYGDGHLFWECTFSPPSCTLGSFPNLPLLCPLTVASGPDV